MRQRYNEKYFQLGGLPTPSLQALERQKKLIVLQNHIEASGFPSTVY